MAENTLTEIGSGLQESVGSAIAIAKETPVATSPLAVDNDPYSFDNVAMLDDDPYSFDNAAIQDDDPYSFDNVGVEVDDDPYSFDNVGTTLPQAQQPQMVQPDLAFDPTTGRYVQPEAPLPMQEAAPRPDYIAPVVEENTPIGLTESLRLEAMAKNGRDRGTLASVLTGLNPLPTGTLENVSDSNLKYLSDVESELDIRKIPAPLMEYFMNSAGLTSMVMDDPMDDWDETYGKNIKDPVERQGERNEYAQSLAREIQRDKLQNKIDAGEQLAGRDKTLWAKIGGGFINNVGYTASFMLNPLYAAARSALERYTGLSQDELGLTDRGIGMDVKYKADSELKALGKASVGAALEVAIEKFGGDYLGKVGSWAFGKAPGGKALMGMMSKLPVVGGSMRAFNKLGKTTGMQGAVPELFEEVVQGLSDNGLGFGMRGSEKEAQGGGMLSRLADETKSWSANRFEKSVDTMLGMLLQQSIQGGAAATVDFDKRVIEGNRLDDLLTMTLGIDKAQLKNMNTKEKTEAYEVIKGQLTPEISQEILSRVGKKAEGVVTRIGEIKNFGLKEGATPVEVRNAKDAFAKDAVKRLAPADTVQIFDTEDQLIEAYPQIALSPDYEKGKTAGTRLGGKSIVILDQVNNPTDIISTVLHESIGHRDLEQLPTEDKKKMLRNLSGEEFERNFKYFRGDGEDKKGMDEEPSAEEAMAYMAETRGSNPSAMQRAVAVVRRHLRKIRPDLKINNSEIQVLFNEAHRRMSQGKAGSYLREVAPIEPEQAVMPDEVAPAEEVLQPDESFDAVQPIEEVVQEAVPEQQILPTPVEEVGKQVKTDVPKPVVEPIESEVADVETGELVDKLAPVQDTAVPDAKPEAKVKEQPPKVVVADEAARSKKVGAVEKKAKKSIKKAPKTIEEADANIAEQKATSEFRGAMKEESEQKAQKEKRSGFILGHAKTIPEGRLLRDIISGGWDKALDDIVSGRVSAERADALAQSALEAGFTDQFTRNRFKPAKPKVSKPSKVDSKPKVKKVKKPTVAKKEIAEEVSVETPPTDLRATKEDFNKWVEKQGKKTVKDIRTDKGKRVVVKGLKDGSIPYTGILVGIGPKNVRIKTTNKLYGEQVISLPTANYAGRYDDLIAFVTPKDETVKPKEVKPVAEKKAPEPPKPVEAPKKKEYVPPKTMSNKQTIEKAYRKMYAEEKGMTNEKLQAMTDKQRTALTDKFDKWFEKKIVDDKIRFRKTDTPTVFHETNIERVMPLIDKGTQADSPFGGDEYFFATSKDMALGQGRNKGVMVELYNDFETKPFKGKPGLEFVEGETGDQELTAKIRPSKLRDSVKSVTIDKGVKGNKTYIRRFNGLMKRAVADGTVTETQNGDNTVTYEFKRDDVKFRKTDTPEFKRWFGDSKVVDKNGEPLNVYHGAQEAFNIFNTADTSHIPDYHDRADRIGAFFTTRKDSAASFAYKDDVVSAYINAKNPLYFKDTGEFWGWLRKNTGKDMTNEDGLEWSEPKLDQQGEWTSGSTAVYPPSPPSATRPAMPGSRSGWSEESYKTKEEAYKVWEKRKILNAMPNGQELIKSMGYDSVIIKQAEFADKDGAEGDTFEDEQWIIIFDSKQAKLTDQITYDNDGKEIPADQRFTDSDDIRFRKSGTDDDLIAWRATLNDIEGKDPIGSPELANLGRDEAGRKLVRNVQEEDKKKKEALKAKEDEDVKEIDRFIADSKSLERDYMEDLIQRHRPLNGAETAWAEEEYDRLVKVSEESGSKMDRAEAGMFYLDYKRTGAEESAGMRARKDRIQTPYQRFKDALEKALYVPTEKSKLGKRLKRMEAKMKKAKTKTQKELIEIERDKLKEMLANETEAIKKKMGLTDEKIEEIAQGYGKSDKGNKIAQQLVNDVASFRSNWQDKAFEFWASGLLSGIPTNVTNVSSNTANQMWELGPQRLAEIGLNKLFGLVGKGQELGAQPGELKYMAKYFGRAFKNAGRNLVDSFRYEQPVFMEQFGKHQIGQKKTTEGLTYEGRQSAIQSYKLGKYMVGGKQIRTPLRLLQAADEASKTVSWFMEASAYAYRQGKVAGIPEGAEMDAYVESQLQDKSSDASIYALNSSVRLAFQTPMSPAMEKHSRAIGDSVFKWVMPFRRTPFNIMATGIRKTPLGALNLAKKAMDGNLSGADAVRLTTEQMVSFAVTGAIIDMIMGGGGDDDDDDPQNRRITGSPPSAIGDRDLRNQARRAGPPPMSIKIGDTWYSYAKIEPFATMLAPIVDSVEEFDRMKTKGKEADDALLSLLKKVQSSSMDKTFIKGLSDLMRIAERPEDAPNYAINFVTSWVPNIIRSTMRAADDKIIERRLGKGGDIGKRMIDRAKYSALPTPGGGNLSPKVGPWGEEIRKADYEGGALTDFALRLLSPMQKMSPPDRNEKAVKLDRMITNWNNQHPDPKDEWAPLAPERYVERNKAKAVLTDDEYSEYLKIAGKRSLQLANLNEARIANPRASDIERIKVALSAGKKYAGNQMWRKVGKTANLRMRRETARKRSTDPQFSSRKDYWTKEIERLDKLIKAKSK